MICKGQQSRALILPLIILVFLGFIPLIAQTSEIDGDPVDELDDPFAELDDAFLDPFALPDADLPPFDGFDSDFGDLGLETDPDEELTSQDESDSEFTSDPQNESDPFGDGFSSFEDLFQDDQMIDQADSIQDSGLDGASNQSSTDDDLLTREGIQLGGRISGGVTADWNWNEPFQGGFSFIEPDSQTLTPRLSTDLTFDARPSSDFRAFLKLRITSGGGGAGGGGDGFTLAALGAQDGTLTRQAVIDGLPAGWTTIELPNGDLQIYDSGNALVQTIPAAAFETQTTGAFPGLTVPGGGNIGTPPVLNIAVYEAFADFSYQDRLLFRFGKHTITWGVGYFWSPADVLNLTALNPEDPTADREGPVSLKTEFPYGIGNALTLYTIINQGAEPLDLAIAPRIDLLLGSVDLGIGGYYQRSLAPRLISTLRFTLGQVDFFGEAVLSRGADRVFVRPSADQSATTEEGGPDLVLDTFEDKTSPFFSGTFGLRYVKNYDSGTNLLLLSQYFFNGIGYGSTIGGQPSTRVLPAAAALLLNPGSNGLAPEETDPDPVVPPALGVGDITNFGRHYAGLVVGLSSLGGGPVSINLAALMNLTDLSTIVTPSLSVRFLDLFTLSFNPRITFGPPGGEFTNPLGLITGDSSSWGTLGLSFGVSIPGRSF